MIPRQFSVTSSRWVSQLPSFAQRALHVDQMEFDSALSQMYSLLVRPSLVSKMSKARNMTKNHYYRDDPAFVVVQVLFLVVATVAWGMATRETLSGILWNVLFAIVGHYLLASVVFATVTWVVVNQFLLVPGGSSSMAMSDGRREVEWQYSFDVHCNGYFAYFMWTRVGLYILMPLAAAKEGSLALFIGNTLLTVGYVAYFYVVFLGYLELPNLTQQQRLMYPIPFIIGVYVLFTLVASWNLPMPFLPTLWGYPLSAIPSSTANW